MEIYEGGELTGRDRQLIEHQQETSAFYSHTLLTDDSDQLTSRWSAEDFRLLLGRLGEWALESADPICRNMDGEVVPLMPRPTVLEVPRGLNAAEEGVLDDLTLNPEKVRGPWKWRLYTWLDIPLVLVGDKRLAMSDVLIALGTFAWHDHMLRIAARVDPDQYSKVSQLRADRMMELCQNKLGAKGWNVRTGFEIPGPPKREIDVFASRGQESLLIQLKSTLRPEAPWEVFKRNEDILYGIAHTAEVRAMMPTETVSFVVTDGYRGDYITWKAALNHGIPIATLDDLGDIGKDPFEAREQVKRRAGFNPDEPAEPLEDRVFRIMGWTITLTDKPFLP